LNRSPPCWLLVAKTIGRRIDSPCCQSSHRLICLWQLRRTQPSRQESSAAFDSRRSFCRAAGEVSVGSTRRNRVATCFWSCRPRVDLTHSNSLSLLTHAATDTRPHPLFAYFRSATLRHVRPPSSIINAASPRRFRLRQAVLISRAATADVALLPSNVRKIVDRAGGLVRPISRLQL